MIHNKENFIIFKGFSTQGIFLIEELPIVPTAEEKKELIEIPGRHGYLVDSENAYGYVEIDVQLNLYNQEDIQKVRNIFKGSGNLILSNQVDRYYKATVTSKIEFDRVIRQCHTALLTFSLQPFAYELKDNTINITNAATINSYSLINETNTTCQPEITVYGSGVGTLIIGNHTIQLKDINGSITLDYELQEAYRISNGTPTNANRDVNCNFEEIQTGTTEISWSGGITGITINPRFRYL